MCQGTPSQPKVRTIGYVRLYLTCSACPEQYDAYIGDKRVAYLRLRHGYFSVTCPNVDGQLVYESHTKGDGCFNYDEREIELRAAIYAIINWEEVQNQKIEGETNA
jgi:hypothetical protein